VCELKYVGNKMATKNRTGYITWIIQAIRIPRVKNSKQNCLEQEFQKRVGVDLKSKCTGEEVRCFENNHRDTQR